MSFLKKIKKVLSLLSPWAKPDKRKKRIKRASHKKTRNRPTQKQPLPKRKKKPVKKTASGRVALMTKPKNKPSKVNPKPQKKMTQKSAVALRKPKAGPAIRPIKKTAKLKRVLVGEVTHYFDRVKVAAFMVTGAPIVLGQALEFEGKNTVFRQEIKSLQIDRVPVKSAQMGDEVGILVKKPVRAGDRVFKVL